MDTSMIIATGVWLVGFVAWLAYLEYASRNT